MADHAGTIPDVDRRYRVVRELEQHYEFPRYATLEAWEQRAGRLREHLLTVQGLWPLPERTPLKAHISGRIEYEDYCIEGAYFESLPGFYCTGNLYRPLGKPGPFPGILNPHGHWQRGRLEHQERGSIRARCITFARMGMVAFAYDMVGYNDSLQVPRHRFASQRGALWGLTLVALQTWNSLRAVDFLESLEDIDPERIGCTGASGGGTQTFIVTAVEPRIKVVAPVNMISAHYQGGCVCENTPGLRTGTYNVEIGALAAPRPMLMVSASGDWTANTPTVEYPAVRSIYQLYGADDKLASVQVDAEHNYNAESRSHVYAWFARWFLGDARLGEGAERDFVVEPDERMRIFASGALPEGALTSAGLECALKKRGRSQLESLIPTTQKQLDQLRRITKTRLEHILAATSPAADQVVAEEGQAGHSKGPLGQELVLGRRDQEDRIPATLYEPSGGQAKRSALVVHGAGREALGDGYGDPGKLLCALLADGFRVLTIDAHYTGVTPDAALPSLDRDWIWSTHNQPLLGTRVQDILTALAYLAATPDAPPPTVIGLGDAGAWALLAAAITEVPAPLCADLRGVDPQDDGLYLETLYAPMIRAYGDLRVAGALVAPRRMMLINTANRFVSPWIETAYCLLDACQDYRTMADAVEVRILLDWLNE